MNMRKSQSSLGYVESASFGLVASLHISESSRSLLGLSQSLDHETHERWARALRQALEKLQLGEVEQVAQEYPDLGSLRLDGRHGFNALHYLAHSYTRNSSRTQQNHMKFVDMLTLLGQNGLDINSTTSVSKQTALHIVAAKRGYSDILKVLLSSSAYVDQVDSSLQTPLHKAVQNGSQDDVIALLEFGADVHVTDFCGHNALHLAAKRKKSVDIMEALLSWGAQVNFQQMSNHFKGPTPLHLTCRYGRVDNAAFLLRRGANPDILESSGMNCFHIAAAKDITGELLAVLLEASPYTSSMNAKDDICGETPLHKAVNANMLVNVRILLNHRAQPNTPDGFGDTPLHKCSSGASSGMQDFTTALLLAKSGSDVNLVNRKNITAKDKADRETRTTVAAVCRQFERVSLLR